MLDLHNIIIVAYGAVVAIGPSGFFQLAATLLELQNKFFIRIIAIPIIRQLKIFLSTFYPHQSVVTVLAGN